MTDDNKTSQRLWRYAQVSGAATNVAARYFGSKLIGKEPDLATIMKETLGNLKGPFMKIAQLLSTIPNVIPEEQASILRELQTNAPPMGWPMIRRRMTNELGEDWEKNFSFFDRDPSAAASLGQVHKAQSLKGEPWACKLQYPNMSSNMEADIQQIHFFMGVLSQWFKAVLTDNLEQEMAERLREELDYIHEAQMTKMYGKIFESISFVHIPKVIDELSTPRLLTMTWLEGKSILDFKEAHEDVRNRLAAQLFQAWYIPFYQYGVIHGDPHMGNYSVSSDLNLNIFDFGCIRIFPPSFIQGVVLLHQALIKNDLELSVQAYHLWGFKNLTKEMIEILNLWAKYVYEPLLDDRVRYIQIDPKEGHALALNVIDQLKQIGQVEPPREFALLNRASVGLGAALLHLKGQQNWHKLYQEIIEDFSVEKILQRQSLAGAL